MNPQEMAQSTLAAHEIARREAAAWTAVRDQIAIAAVNDCRDVLGMTLRQTSRELEISRTTLARTLWAGKTSVPEMVGPVSDLKEKYLDSVWIAVGQPRLASPEAQFEAGLIDAFERDSLIDQFRLARTPIDRQIRDVVRRFPGIGNSELPRLIVAAFLKGSVPDLRHHAEDADCAVDGGRRWWPTKHVSQLLPGDEIPHYIGDFDEGESYSWVTIESVRPQGVFGDTCDVAFRCEDGTRSIWKDTPEDERQPVKIWREQA